MTLNEMWALYCRVMRWEVATTNGPSWHTDGARFTLRVWDGMDGCWCDVVANVDLAFALRAWCERTENGTKATKYADIDYYKIFPADTKLLYSGGFTMRGEESNDQ